MSESKKQFNKINVFKCVFVFAVSKEYREEKEHTKSYSGSPNVG